MRDTIYREDAIEAINKSFDKETLLKCFVRKIAIDAIIQVPSADRPQDDDWEKYSDKLWKNAYERGKADRPQGEWINGEHDVAMCDGYRCNRCDFFVPWDYEHKFIDFIDDYNFCPSCGCRMRKENE